jgi:hypothetical protein
VRLVVDASAEGERPDTRRRHDRRRQPTVHRAQAPAVRLRQPVAREDEPVGRQHGHREIGWQEVTQKLGELAAKIGQVEQCPDQHEQRVALLGVAANQAPDDQRGAGQTGETQRRPRGPLHDVLERERHRRRAGPLNHERHVDRARADLGPVGLVGKPLRVRPQTPHRRPQERVRLGNPKRDERPDQGHADGRDAVQELGGRRSSAPRPDECQAQHGQQHHRADLAGRGQSSQHPGQQGIHQTFALPGPLTKEQRRGREARDEGVDGEKVGQLDVQHGQRKQQRRQMRHAHAKNTPGQQPGEDNRAEIGDRGQRAPDAVDGVVAGVARPLGNNSRQRERQLPVRVALLAVVVRTEGRALGIEVVSNRGGHADLARHDREKTLVRMLVGIAVPRLESVQSKAGGDHQDDAEHHELQAARSTVVICAW